MERDLQSMVLPKIFHPPPSAVPSLPPATHWNRPKGPTEVPNEAGWCGLTKWQWSWSKKPETFGNLTNSKLFFDCWCIPNKLGKLNQNFPCVMVLGECLLCLLCGVHSTTVFVFERPRILDQCSIFGKWFVMPCLTENPPRISFLKVKVEIISPYFTPHSCAYMLPYCSICNQHSPPPTLAIQVFYALSPLLVTLHAHTALG